MERDQSRLSELLDRYEAGDTCRAKQLAKELLRFGRPIPVCHTILCVILTNEGDFEAAEHHGAEAVRLSPSNVGALGNLGNVLLAKEQYRKALHFFRRVLCISPESVEALNNLGVCLKQTGRLLLAEKVLSKAHSWHPEREDVLCNLGVVQAGLGNHSEARRSLLKVLAVNSRNAVALNSMASLSLREGCLDTAMRHYDRAVYISPDLYEARVNRALLLSELGSWHNAEAELRDLTAKEGNRTQAKLGLANLLRSKGQLSEALALLLDIKEVKRRSPQVLGDLGLIYCDLRRYTKAISTIKQAITAGGKYKAARSNLLFSYNYTSASKAEILEEARAFGDVVSGCAEPKFTEWSVDFTSTRLRVGFISGDFRNHPVGYFLAATLEKLDADAFQLFAFSNNYTEDELTHRLKKKFSYWRVIRGLDDRGVAEHIHNLGIHVLFDLSGHSAYNRLSVFAYRPAPVQVSWLGYFSTTGLREMDYFLGDPILCRDGEESFFTEKLYRLKQCWFCSDSQSPLNSSSSTQITPVEKNGIFTFACFGNLSKVNDEVLEAWASILLRTNRSRIYIKARQLQDPDIAGEITAFFVRRGVSKNRVTLEGQSARETYFERLRSADVILDTFPYPGGTTSVDALAMGVPVLTMKGDRFVSRLGESIARNSGGHWWVAEDRMEYINKASYIASNLASYKSHRMRIAREFNNHPLYDCESFAINFRHVIMDMWEQRRSQLVPS